MMISIDFGNSYTKVGLRREDSLPTTALRDGSLEHDDQLNICIPTVAARLDRADKQQWFYGTEVASLGEGPELTVYRNWKPLFFRQDESTIDELNELVVAAKMSSAQLYSEENDQGVLSDSFFRLVKSELRLSDDQTAGLRGIMMEKLGSPKPFAPVEPDDIEMDFKAIGAGYFRWLRSFIAPLCRQQGVDLDNVPVRIMLPNFGPQTQGEQLLVEILSEAGWKPAERHAALKEPLANTLGVFTEGRTTFGRRRLARSHALTTG